MTQERFPTVLRTLLPAVENAVQTQLHPRFRKRVPCAFVEQGVAHLKFGAILFGKLHIRQS